MRAMLRARRCRALPTRAGAMSIFLMTGASRGRWPRTQPSGGNGAYLPTGIGWYRKRFRVPVCGSRPGRSTGVRRRVSKQRGVDQRPVPRPAPYGFVPFAYELTPYLKFDAENVIAVKVDNSRQTNCRWYSGSGIYRHAWLPITNPVRVAHWGTFVTCPRRGEGVGYRRGENTHRERPQNRRAMHADDRTRWTRMARWSERRRRRRRWARRESTSLCSR